MATMANNKINDLKITKLSSGLYDLDRSDDASFSRAEGKDANAQFVSNKFMTGRASYYYDPTYGIPYLQKIIAKTPPPSLHVVTGLFTKEALSIKNVLGLAGPIQLGFDESASVMAVDMTLNTTEGLVRYTAEQVVGR